MKLRPLFRSSHLVPVMAMLGAIALAFARVLGPGRGLYTRDHMLVFRGRWQGVVDAVFGGQLPNLAYSSAGEPLEQVINATYAPTTLILFLGPFEVTYDLFVATHFFGLAAGTYALAVTLGAKRAEALLGAVGVTLVGPVISTENLLISVQALMYVPWILLVLTKVLHSPSWPRVGLLGLALGFHAQAIQPEWLVLDAAAAGLLFAHLKPRATVALGGRLLIAVFLGAALCAIEVMPVVEMLPHSRRGLGFGFEEATHHSFTGWSIIELFAPSFWAQPDLPHLRLPFLTGTDNSSYLFSLYFGTTIPIVIAGRYRGLSRWVWGLVFLLFLFSLGASTPFYRWLWHIPPFSSSRYPIKYWTVLACAIPLLLILGMRCVEANPKRLLVPAFAQMSLLVGTIIAISSSDFLEFLRSANRPDLIGTKIAGVADEAWPAIAVEAIRGHVALALVMLSLLFGVALVAAVRKWPASWVRWGLVSIVLLDLGIAARLAIPGVDRLCNEIPSELAELYGDSEYRVMHLSPQRRPAVAADLPDQGYFQDILISSARRGRFGCYPARSLLVDDRNGITNSFLLQACHVLVRTPGEDGRRIMSRFGVKHLSTRAEGIDEKIVASIIVPGEPERELVYELPDVRPYVHGYTRWWATDMTNETQERARKFWSSPDTREIALVDASSGRLTKSSTTCTSTVHIERAPMERPDQIEAEVESECPTVVVVREPAMVGWTALVNDRPVDLLQAEAGFLAAAVPAGRHRVRFEYEALSVRWQWVSLLALLTILALIIPWKRLLPTQVRARRRT